MATASGRIPLRAAALLEERLRPAATRATVRVRLGIPDRRRLPAIGIAAGGQPSAEALALLDRLRPAHLGLDAPAGSPGPDAALARWLDAARAAGVPVELRLEAGGELGPEDGPDGDRADAGAVLDRLAGVPGLARVILVGPNEAPPSPSAVARVRAALAGRPSVQLAVGTRGPFAVLNRAWDRVPGSDAIAFALNPQVHADDPLTILENLESLPDMIRTARLVGRAEGVHVSPLTLSAPGADAPRLEAEPFGAAWTVAAAANLAWGGAASVTLHALVGRHALVLPGAAASATADVVARLGAWRGARLVAVEGSGDHPVAALALARGDRRAVLLANLGTRPCEARVEGLARPEPGEAWPAGGTSVRRDGTVSVELPGYGTAILDGPAATPA